MSELFHQLGINWKLLIAQGVNFLVVLTVLTLLVYRPLMRMLDERRRKIDGGVKYANEMEGKMKEIDRLKDEKMAVADKKAVEVISKAEKEGQEKFQGIMVAANKKAETMMQEATAVAERKRLAEMEQLIQQAHILVKQAIIKTVELDPAKVDEQLVRKAVEAVKGNK